MDILGTMLQKVGLNYEDLNTAEKQYLEDLQKKYVVKELTIADVRSAMEGMCDALARELSGYETPANFTAFLFRNKRRRHLEARLKNALMLRDFLSAPDKARQMIEKMLKNVKQK